MKKVLVPILLVLLVAAIGYIIYLKAGCKPSGIIYHPCGDSNTICLQGYKVLYGNDSSKVIMLGKIQKDAEGRIVGRPVPHPGSTIERTLGVEMIQAYQKPLDDINDSATMRYVQFGIANVIDYAGYLLAIGEQHEVSAEDMDIRVFLAQSSKDATLPNGSHINQNTIIITPRIPEERKNNKTQAFLTMVKDWLFFDQGSICPKCDDFTGLNESK